MDKLSPNLTDNMEGFSQEKTDYSKYETSFRQPDIQTWFANDQFKSLLPEVSKHCYGPGIVIGRGSLSPGGGIFDFDSIDNLLEGRIYEC